MPFEGAAASLYSDRPSQSIGARPIAGERRPAPRDREHCAPTGHDGGKRRLRTGTLMKSHFAAIGIGAAIAVAFIGGFVVVAPQLSDGDDADGVISIGDEKSSEFRFTADGYRIKARWDGAFELAPDGAGFVSRDGPVSIEIEREGVRRRARFDEAGVAYAEGEGAFEKGAAAEEKANALAQEFARASGVGAEARVAGLVGAGGAAAVRSEIDAATTDAAAAALIIAVAPRDDLDADDFGALAARIAAFSSDYEKRRALGALIASPALKDAGVVISAAAGIVADHEKRIFIENAATKAPDAVALAAVIGGIADERERRLAIAALAPRASGDEGLDAALRAAAATIGDERERRLALEALG